MPLLKYAVRKVRALAQLSVTILLSFLLWLWLVLTRKTLLVNFRSGGMGHLAKEPAVVLVRSELYGRSTKNTVLVLQGVANRVLLKHWRRFFFFFHSQRINQALMRCCKWPGVVTFDMGVAPPDAPQPSDSPAVKKDFTMRRIVRYKRWMRDVQRYRHQKKKRLLELEADVIEQGWRSLAKLGIEKEQPFVCLHAGEVTVDGRFGYELHRRQKIEDYVGLIEHLVNKRIRVVRMGDRDLPPASNSIPVVDYPRTSQKSEAMDLFLIWACFFFIGCNSGLQDVAVIFGKPQLITNVIPWQMVAGFDGDLYLPKPIVWRKNNELVSLKAFFEHELYLAQFEVPDEFYVEPNDATDLIAAAEEMEKLLSGEATLPDPWQKKWRDAFPAEVSEFLCSEVQVSSAFVRRHEKALFKDMKEGVHF